jgi:uncharacterized BrkB/YihY/UPF0761 family membrane protein
VLVSIFGLVLQDDSIRADVVDAVVDALPVSVAGKKDVEDAITAIATPASAAGLVSLIVFAWAATGMMTALRQGLERAMGVTESRPMMRGKLVDLVLIMGAAVLVLVTVGITVLGNLVQRASASGSWWASAPARSPVFSFAPRPSSCRSSSCCCSTGSCRRAACASATGLRERSSPLSSCC